MVAEIIKLGGIAIIGFLIVVIGFSFQKHKHHQKHSPDHTYSHKDTQPSSISPNLHPAEEKAKNYIAQYKANYPRESIKAALVKAGNSPGEVESWLQKYF